MVFRVLADWRRSCRSEWYTAHGGGEAVQSDDEDKELGFVRAMIGEVHAVWKSFAAKSLKHSANAVLACKPPKRPLHLTTRNHHPQSYSPPLKFLPRAAISSTAFTLPHSIIGDHVLFRPPVVACLMVVRTWNSCIDDPLHRSGHHLFLKRNSV